MRMTDRTFFLIFAVLSLSGGILSVILLRQHHDPSGGTVLLLCGHECAEMSRLPLSSLLSVPLAAWGLAYYIAGLLAALVALAGSDRIRAAAAAVLLPVSALAAGLDAVLAFILWQYSLFCALCALTYGVNIINLAVMIFAYSRSGGRFAERFRHLFGNPDLRVALMEGVLLLAAVPVIVLFLNAAWERSSPSRPSPEQLEAFLTRFYSTPVESLPAGDALLSLGAPEAPVVITAYTDFHCPACRELFLAEKHVLERFPGKVRVVYYCFPLDRVCNPLAPRTAFPNSCLAARSFIAAARLGLFSSYADRHFARFVSLSARIKSGEALASLRDFLSASSPGVETEAALWRDMTSGRTEQTLKNHIRSGEKAGVRAVPTVFINGRRLDGVPGREFLAALVANELRSMR